MLDLRDVQEAPHHVHRNRANRDVHEEHPAPAINPENLVSACEETSNEWPEHARGSEDGDEEALVLGAFARSNHVGDDREREGHQSTATDSLNGTEYRESGHRPRETGQD